MILAHGEMQTMLGRLWGSVDGKGSVWGLLRSLNRLERSSQGRNSAKTGIDTYPATNLARLRSKKKKGGTLTGGAAGSERERGGGQRAGGVGGCWAEASWSGPRREERKGRGRARLGPRPREKERGGRIGPSGQKQKVFFLFCFLFRKPFPNKILNAN